jgi:hypothetical protein
MYLIITTLMPLMPEHGLSASGLELRHPIDKGFYWQKRQQSWVYFYWRFNDKKKEELTLQISRKPSFAEIHHEKNVLSPPYIWHNGDQGTFYWRLVSSEDSDHKKMVRSFTILPEVTKQPDKPEPRDFVELRHPIEKGYYWQKRGVTWVRFYWRFRQPHHESSQELLLQTSSTPEFHDILLETQVNSPPYIWKNSYYGHVYWRLVTKGQKKTEYSDTRYFRIIADDTPRPMEFSPRLALQKRENIPEDPFLELRHPKDKGFYWQKDQQTWVRFFWKFRKGHSQDVILQVSRSALFHKLLHERRLRKPPYVWRHRLKEKLYWRLAIVDKKRTIKSSSPTRSIEILPEQNPSTTEKADTLVTFSPEIQNPAFETPPKKKESPPPITQIEATGPEKELTFTRIRPTANFSWDKVDPVMHYRFQVAEDIDFKQPIYDKELQNNRIDLTNLAAGSYFWRVGAKQYENHPTIYSDIGELTVTKLAPQLTAPSPLYPVPQGRLKAFGKTAPVKFEWESLEDDEAVSYILQISTQENFSEAQKFATFEPSVTANLAPGSYFWQVMVVNQHTEESPWSPIQDFVIKKASTSLATEFPLDKAVIPSFFVDFRWKKSDQCSSYEIVAASSNSFKDLIVHEEISSTEFQFEFDDEDTYYWYASCIKEDGDKVQSTTAMFEINLEEKDAH